MTQNEIYVLLVSSLRYALAKPGIHLEEICELVRKHACQLTKTQLEVLVVELRSQAHGIKALEDLLGDLQTQMAAYSRLV